MAPRGSRVRIWGPSLGYASPALTVG
jgi:hypothetical protein